MTSYPPAPWHMHGSMWLSVYRLARDVDERHPKGIYAVALVDYTEPSPLTYHELLSARVITAANGKKAVSVVDIWVDSPDSVAGGRTLWAIPKGLAKFSGESSAKGPLATHTWEASLDDGPIATARFSDVTQLAPRAPMRGSVEQPGIEEHPDTAWLTMKGGAKLLPARGSWTFDPDGPLAYLRDATKIASFRGKGFDIAFG
ncbi:MAG: acetoacetate decarboxylase family protein [Nocardioides sp.]